MKVKKIKLNELFSVDGKIYLVNNPTTPSQDTNEHGQILVLLTVM